MTRFLVHALLDAHSIYSAWTSLSELKIDPLLVHALKTAKLIFSFLTTFLLQLIVHALLRKCIM